MRILCINNKPLPDTWNEPDMLAAINEGKIYEGRPAVTYGPDDIDSPGWVIPSISVTRGYANERFIPADNNLDETELVTEEFKEKYCVPVNS